MDAMRAKIEVHQNYDVTATDLDMVELLKIIKGVAFNFKTQKNTYQRIQEMMQKYKVTHQGWSKTVQEYRNKFVNPYDVVVACGRRFDLQTTVVDSILADLHANQLTASDA
jgi:regulator of RNase E activity RraB